MDYIIDQIAQKAANMISESQGTFPVSTEIIVAIIAGLCGVLTLIINKRQELAIKQRNIKEEKYISFLSSLISSRANYTNNSMRTFTETLQIIYLIGSSEVVNAANDFVELMTGDAPNPEVQNIRYNNLLRAMRKDLYGKKYNENYPSRSRLIIGK